MLKIPKHVPKWSPKWVRPMTEMGPLGALVGHLGPEVPHKGPKGSNMSQKVPKTSQNRPQIDKKNLNTRIQNGSQNLSATIGTDRCAYLPGSSIVPPTFRTKGPWAGRGGIQP